MLFSPIDPNAYNFIINPAMHIPDGFLSLTISIIFWGIAILLIALAVQRTKGELGERQEVAYLVALEVGDKGVVTVFRRYLSFALCAFPA